MAKNLAFVFPGQGSQFIGMLDLFITRKPKIVLLICQEASDVMGYDILKLISKDSENKLNQTVYTQPALLTAGFIAWHIWQEENKEQPSWLAGHSLGEYTALVCSGALTFEEGLKLVKKRGELMQNAVPKGMGSMSVILGLQLSQINKICANVDAQAANINAPGQIVVAGTYNAINIVIDKAKNLGAKRAIILPISVPSHCMLMKNASEKLIKELNKINWHIPKIKVIHNYDITYHKSKKDICNALANQLFNPVRWIDTIKYLAQKGVNKILECSPGNILTGLNKRIESKIENVSISEEFKMNVYAKK